MQGKKVNKESGSCVRMKKKILIFYFYLMGNFWLVEDEDKEESSITESSLFIDLEKKQLIGEIR